MTVEQRYDGTKILGELSGLSPETVRDIWEEVKLNQQKLNRCPCHCFDTTKTKPQDVGLLRKLTCIRCDGWLSLTDVGMYIRGYEAAGKSAEDIWPGYRAMKPAHSP